MTGVHLNPAKVGVWVKYNVSNRHEESECVNWRCKTHVTILRAYWKINSLQSVVALMDETKSQLFICMSDIFTDKPVVSHSKENCQENQKTKDLHRGNTSIEHFSMFLSKYVSN